MANKTFDNGNPRFAAEYSVDQHKGANLCDTTMFLCPVRVGAMAKGGDPMNSRSDSDGDQLVGNGHYPVDGDANVDSDGRTTAAYPAPNLFTSVVD